MIVPPGHVLAKQKAITAEDLATLPFVDRDPGAAIRALGEGFFRDNGVSPDTLNRRAELGSLAAIKHLVRQGVGFAIVSRAALGRDRKDGTLIGISLKPRLYSSLNVLVPKDRFRARLHSTFAEFVVSFFAETEKSVIEAREAQDMISDNPQP